MIKTMHKIIYNHVIKIKRIYHICISKEYELTIFTDHKAPCSPRHQKNCISIVLDSSWDDGDTQENGYAKFWV